MNLANCYLGQLDKIARLICNGLASYSGGVYSTKHLLAISCDISWDYMRVANFNLLQCTCRQSQLKSMGYSNTMISRNWKHFLLLWQTFSIPNLHDYPQFPQVLISQTNFCTPTCWWLVTQDSNEIHIHILNYIVFAF